MRFSRQDGANDISEWYNDIWTQFGQLQNLPSVHEWVKMTQVTKVTLETFYTWHIKSTLIRDEYEGFRWFEFFIWIFSHWLIMMRSRNWPDLWSQILKIRDKQVVGIYDLMKRWKIETNRIRSVATAQPQSQKPIFDFDLTWWPDLWWPGANFFYTRCLIQLLTGIEKMFPLYAKNRRGGHFLPPPQCAC